MFFAGIAGMRAVGVLFGRWLGTAELAKKLPRRLAVAESWRLAYSKS